MQFPSILFLLFFVFGIGQLSCQSSSGSSSHMENQNVMQEPTAEVQFQVNLENKRVDVLFDGELFTAYIFPDEVAKPILYPLMAKNGQYLTRGYPIEPKPGERVDHPHHIGHWLNYGDVNDLDFWNNSGKVSEERKHKYGAIYHEGITETKVENGKGILGVTASWKSLEGDHLLDEKTSFQFWEMDHIRVIERRTTLTAKKKVNFNDNKEGMVAIRVRREMELPLEKPALFLDANGNRMAEKTVNNEGVVGNYLSSEGLEGNDVWGTRARWMNLYSQVHGESLAITIIDHPENVGYPTYWHARGYGLFAANPLGQKVFSKGEEALNFSLDAGQSVTFNYRILISSGKQLSAETIEKQFKDFSAGKY